MSAKPSNDTRQRVAAAISTVGLAGHSPLAPGTMGALVAWGVYRCLPSISVVWAIVLLSGLTWLFVREVQVYLENSPNGPDDPQEVVIDEFIGCLIALSFAPDHWHWELLAFVLFRFFDMAKPGPVGWLDRKVKSAWGVVGDDVVAGLMAGVVVWGVADWLGASL